MANLPSRYHQALAAREIDLEVQVENEEVEIDLEIEFLQPKLEELSLLRMLQAVLTFNAQRSLKLHLSTQSSLNLTLRNLIDLVDQMPENLC